MEIMQGKLTRLLDAGELAQHLAGYRRVLIDLGTGDGRFVLHAARRDPELFVIGLDACRENLVHASRSAPANTLFVIANAYKLPVELNNLAMRVTIHFPWGSLLDGLLDGHPDLLQGLQVIMRPGAGLEVHLNASALGDAGWSFDAGGQRVWHVLSAAGWRLKPLHCLDAAALRGVPSTWARRMAYGRQPKAAVITTG